MPETYNQEQQWEAEMARDRLRQHAEAMHSRQQFTQNVQQDQAKSQDLKGAQRFKQAGAQLKATREAYNRTRKLPKEESTDKSKTGMWIMIFMVSILGDIFTLIPVAGNFFCNSVRRDHLVSLCNQRIFQSESGGQAHFHGQCHAC